jgi:hypothetical protein
MVSAHDVAALNERYAPWKIEKSSTRKTVRTMSGLQGRRKLVWLTQARNTDTDEVIYTCEGWSQAARGQALNAILNRRAKEQS